MTRAILVPMAERKAYVDPFPNLGRRSLFAPLGAASGAIAREPDRIDAAKQTLTKAESVTKPPKANVTPAPSKRNAGGRAREHETPAQRQKAYRERKAAEKAEKGEA